MIERGWSQATPAAITCNASFADAAAWTGTIAALSRSPPSSEARLLEQNLAFDSAVKDLHIKVSGCFIIIKPPEREAARLDEGRRKRGQRSRDASGIA
ncbi:MAG: hypothetical protein E2P02_21180 [Acidobacteria bacterium]|nr:MAG: hypothetical protein E2P02_21180 [Acidobacteriota bacterium]